MKTNSFLSVACALLVTEFAFATDRLVPSQYATIQAAISASVSGDTIRIAPGTYAELLSIANKTLAITGSSTAAQVIVRSSNGSRLLSINDAAAGASTFRNLTLTGGTSQDLINVTAGNPTFEYCIFQGNQKRAVTDSRSCSASEGAKFRHCFFSGNVEPNGGAVRLNSVNALFEDCVFADNRASGPTSGVNAGGACYVDDWNCGTHTFTFTRCVFINNSAVWGGAIFAQGVYPSASSRLVINSCQFVNNSATQGMSLYNWYITCPVSMSWYCAASDQIRNGWTDSGGNTFTSSCAQRPFADCDANSVPDQIQIDVGLLPDSNRDGIPDGCQCIGDILVDGMINGADLGAVLSYWGPVTSSPASQSCDLNGDSYVNGADMGILLGKWGACSQ
jgi:predicted outer membrane repeat protein